MSSYCNKSLSLLGYTCALFFFCALTCEMSQAQETGLAKSDSAPISTAFSSTGREFEEIVVSLDVQRLLQRDIFVQYDGQTVYLPLVDVFTTLEMNITADPARGRFSGYLFKRNDKFEISLEKGKARTPYTDQKLTGLDYFYDGQELFLRIDLFEPMFGLPFEFNFSRLRVYLPLNKELPAYQKFVRRKAHENLLEKRVELRDVRFLAHQREMLKVGVADWTVSTSPVGGGGQYATLNTGAMLLGGDFSLSATGNTRVGFDSDQLKTRWRYYVEDKSYVTHVNVGDLFTGGGLSRSLRGAQVTNKPLIQRRYFQTISVAGDVGPDWEVELYVDNKLIDFTLTDQDGSYRFDLDVFYGSSIVTLKMYGPNGELRTEERFVRAPFNLLPKGELDYTFSLGKGEFSDSADLYSNLNSQFGVLSAFTVGVSGDLPLGSAGDEKATFAVEAALQPLSNIVLSSSFSPNNRVQYSLNYSKPSLINITGSYIGFFDNPTRNRLSQKSRLTVSLSSPLRIWGKSLGLRANVSLDKFDLFKTTNMNYGLSASIGPTHFNYLGKYKTTHLQAFSLTNISSQLFATIRISRWLRPQMRVEYSHSDEELVKYGVYLSKRIFRTGQITLSFERNNINESNTYMMTFNLLTDFATVSSRTMVIGKQISSTQMYRGSIQFDQDSKDLRFSRRSAVGYGSAVVRPFLDANYNGVFDDDEELIRGLRAKISGARGYRRSDDLYIFERLRAYGEHMVEIDMYSLDDPTLRPANENLQVLVNPNMVTTINVPVVTASDVSGSIKRFTFAGDVGAGGIRLNLLNLSKDVISQIVTFNDGDYYFLGLLPGRYRAYPDAKQLEKYGYYADPEFIEFEVEPVAGGVSIEDINFVLVPR